MPAMAEMYNLIWIRATRILATFMSFFFFSKPLFISIQNISYNPWASLVAHIVKNLPAVQEISVRSLGPEDSGEGTPEQAKGLCIRL